MLRKLFIEENIIYDLKNKYADSLEKFDIFYNVKTNTINLSSIVVSEESRGTGVGTKVMNDIISLADKNKSIVTLTPSSDYGGNKKRLIDFYKRFGFVQNKGKNIDYAISEDMYRIPE